jgi:tetratricopeptide (TPR) repeat protein
MLKENIMSLVLGLVVGLVVGFVFANNFNRSDSQRPSAANGLPGPKITDGSLPPPGGNSASDRDEEARPQPQIAAAIERAKSRPQDYEAQMTAADLYYQIKRFDDAAKFYEAAGKLKPSEAEPMIKAGNAFFDGEKYDEAEKWYERALSKDAKNVAVRTDLGLTFFLREPRDIERAIKEYSGALAIDPNHEFALQNLALAYIEKGDRTSFQSTLERLRKVNPNNPVVTKSDAP